MNPPRHPAETNVPHQGFVATRWTLVLRASGGSAESRAALSELCEAYYAPVRSFIRRLEPDPENARDLTHSFFEELLSGRGVEAADPSRGRFRSYLLGAVKHFLAETRRKSCAAKRGGGQDPVPLGVCAQGETATELHVPAPETPPPDMVFDRHWAATLVDRAGAALAAECASAGRGEQFLALKPWLLGEVSSLSQAGVARELGLSEGAVKVAIHRLRRRFRELVKTEIAQTVADPAQVADELRYLVEVLAQPPIPPAKP